MRLTYSILWFDDDDEYLESIDQDFIKEEFAKWGFNCSLTLVHNIAEFEAAAPYQTYDLILFDYSLDGAGDGLYGQEFIKKVREQQVLTEIIFYSSHQVSLLWDAIRNEMLEGVFIASRNSGVDNKLFKVAKQSIHKVLDLENMRGIVMAEVGSNDEFLTRIAINEFEHLNAEEQLDLLNKYVGYVEQQTTGITRCAMKAVEDQNLEALFELLDSAKKWRFCQSLSKKLTHLNINTEGNYLDDVLNKRNFLAHGLPEKLEDDSLKFEYRGKEFIFDESASAELRQKLTCYGAFFESIVDQY